MWANPASCFCLQNGAAQQQSHPPQIAALRVCDFQRRDFEEALTIRTYTVAMNVSAYISTQHGFTAQP